MRANQFGFFRKILDLRPDLANSGGKNLRAPLAAAAWAGNRRIMSLLLEKGADINCGGLNGRLATPLWKAASNHDLKTVRFLVVRGAGLELMAQEIPGGGGI